MQDCQTHLQGAQSVDNGQCQKRGVHGEHVRVGLIEDIVVEMRSQGHAQGHGTEVDHVQNGHPNGALLQRGNVRDVGETGGENGHIGTRQGRWQGGRIDDVLHRPRGHPGIDHYHRGVYELAHQSHEHRQLSAATIGEGAQKKGQNNGENVGGDALPLEEPGIGRC